MTREYTPVESFEAGGVAYRPGFVTVTRSIAGRRGAELEDALGYSRGMLDEGWWFLQLDEPVEVGEFEFGGYTHFPDATSVGEASTVHESLEERYTNFDGEDPAWLRRLHSRQWDALRAEAAERLNRGGADRIAKVVPVGKGEYPVGLGVVQYRLTALKRFRVVLFVPAGARVVAASSTDPTSFKVDP